MQCPRCQHENEAGAQFCEECAVSLARTCANCGRQLSPTAKFCPKCAHPTERSAAPPQARRFGSPETYTPKHLAEKMQRQPVVGAGERGKVAHWSCTNVCCGCVVSAANAFRSSSNGYNSLRLTPSTRMPRQSRPAALSVSS